MLLVRILVVADGLEPSLHLTVVGLAERGHRVRVIGAIGPEELDPVEQFRLGPSLKVSGGEPGGAVRQAGRVVGRAARSAAYNAAALRVVTARAGRTHGFGRRFARQLSASLPVLETRADVVYFEAANVAAQHAAVLDQLGPKLVMCTGSDVRVLPDLDARLAQTLPAVFAQAGRVVCRSEDLQRWAVRRGAPVERTLVLYPAVDTTFFVRPYRPARPGDALRLVSVGRMHWVKGYDDAIQAVALARQAGHDVTLTIVGPDRGTREALEYAVRDLGLDAVVALPGSKSGAGIRDALARADAFVVSSVAEGVSRAALEAMAMGLPVVTTDAGGMAEVVEDGVVGLVVPRRDPRALADAIGTLARDPSLRSAMGQRALSRAQQFDARAHLDRLEQILVQLVDDDRAGNSTTKRA